MSEELGVLGVITPPLYHRTVWVKYIEQECFHVCSINVAHSSIENLYIHQKARVHNLLSGTQVSSGIGGKFLDAVHERHAKRHSQYTT